MTACIIFIASKRRHYLRLALLHPISFTCESKQHDGEGNCELNAQTSYQNETQINSTYGPFQHLGGVEFKL